MDIATVRDLANRLDQSERTRQQIRQFSLEYPDITIADAYEIQRAWMSIKLGRGRAIRGRKIGLTSKAMQYSSNIAEPDYGVLLDDMFFDSGDELPPERFIKPRVEVELAFVLRRPLRGPDNSLSDVLNATDAIMPAVEIIDARIEQVDSQTGVTRKVTDTISDNAANAAVVLGKPFEPNACDLRWIAAICKRNGEIEESGVAAAVLNHPANGIAWLANKLALYGEELKPGEIILAGSFTRPVLARRGDTFDIEYRDLGSIKCHFS